MNGKNLTKDTCKYNIVGKTKYKSKRMKKSNYQVVYK